MMDLKLRRIYFASLLPAILGFLLGYWIKAYGFIADNWVSYTSILAPIIFTLAATFAIALPIFYRALFAHVKRHRKSISEAELAGFERNLLFMVLVTPYLALIAFILDFPRFYAAGTILLGIYGIYYFYPSKRRIALDRHIYRVIPDVGSAGTPGNELRECGLNG